MVNPYGNLLEEAVLSASPMELTNMLFEKLLSDLETARNCLARGETAARNRSAGRAVEILLELLASLDDIKGGELGRNLRRLYAYALEQVLDGNARQDRDGFDKAETVLRPLAEAWKELTGSPSASLDESAAPFPPSLDESSLSAFSFRG